MGKVIGIIFVLAVAALFAVLTCKSKHSDLFKWVGIGVFIAFCLTWVIPNGYFNEGTFAAQGLQRLGLSDIPTLLYYAVYFCLTTVIYILVLGGFYGVVSKTKAYQGLVKKFAKAVKDNRMLYTIIFTVVLVGFASIMKSTFALVFFIPFLISVLLEAKFDKLTTMSVTFGSLLVGTLAATYGTDGLLWFNNYTGAALSVGLTYRLIIAGIALLLFCAFNILRVRKINKNNKSINEQEDDLFAVSDVKGKYKSWPTIVVLAIVAVIVILGFVQWEASFNITCFKSFHTWLTGLTIGKDFKIFSYILGTGAVAFGSFELTHLIIVLLIATVVIAFVNRMKLVDFMTEFGNGFAKMLKPACLYALAYLVFVVSYMTPFMPAISNYAWGLTKSFNPFINTGLAFVTSIFHADLGYTGYLIGATVQANYSSSFGLLHTLYVSTYGLVQLFIPTSGLLLLGLSYLKLDYKAWFKYIWMFAAVMLVVILVFATIVTYA